MTVRLNKQESVATLTLDREDKLNAMSEDMWDMLYEHITGLARDDDARVVILLGAGRAFSSGGDISNMAKADVISGRTRAKRRHRAITALYNLEKPTIAAVRGPCYGIANGMALACDLILASETAKFSMGFKHVGVVPDGGVIFFLMQLLSVAKAKELVYTARPFGAQEAKELGIVLKVVPDADLEKEALTLAQETARSATYALALTKKMFQSMAVPTLEMLLETECLASGVVRLTYDHEEGVAAFKERRPPVFQGR